MEGIDGIAFFVVQDNEGLLETSKRYPGAIVSNHISYLDILYHMSSSFPSFVAKVSGALRRFLMVCVPGFHSVMKHKPVNGVTPASL